VSNFAINIGRVTNRQGIIAGVAPEQLAEIVQQHKEHSETQKKLILRLEETLDLNQRQIRAALDILGEANVPPERLAAKLIEIAERFKGLQASVSAQPGDDTRISGLKGDAQKAIEAGELGKADMLLAEVETEQRRVLDRLAVQAADTSARRGEIALTRLRYLDAAGHFANAANAIPPRDAHEQARTDYLAREARALFQQGDEFGDNTALLSAIACYRRLADWQPPDRVPLRWALTQNNLGVALSTLGERESGTARLEEAVATYREALKEYPRERVPLDWAMTQTNLGNALSTLGARESGTTRLEEAVAAYRDALKETTRERAPLQWATTQNNLGDALSRLGARESGTAQLEEAIVALREALKEYTRERVPLDWAMTQTNLGNALSTLGARESGTARLEEAVAAYRDALKEYTRERAPLQMRF
jgi:tetratricopeptide (TPR) repeat protein